MSRTSVQVKVHDTEPVIFDALAQVFLVRASGDSTWVGFVDAETGVEVTFFKTKGESDVESVESDGPGDAAESRD